MGIESQVISWFISYMKMPSVCMHGFQYLYTYFFYRPFLAKENVLSNTLENTCEMLSRQITQLEFRI